jgi:hypothetical protein
MLYVVDRMYLQVLNMTTKTTWICTDCGEMVNLPNGDSEDKTGSTGLRW